MIKKIGKKFLESAIGNDNKLKLLRKKIKVLSTVGYIKNIEERLELIKKLYTK